MHRTDGCINIVATTFANTKIHNRGPGYGINTISVGSNCCSCYNDIYIYTYLNKDKNSRDTYIICVEVSGICDACVFGVSACGVKIIQNSTDEPVLDGYETRTDIDARTIMIASCRNGCKKNWVNQIKTSAQLAITRITAGSIIST